MLDQTLESMEMSTNGTTFSQNHANPRGFQSFRVTGDTVELLNDVTC